MLSFWESGYVFYVAAVVCVLGAAAKWLVSQRYKKLMKQGDSLGNAKDKQLKLMRGRYDNVCRVMGNVPNPRVFVEKSLLDYRFLWTSLERMDRVCRWSSVFVLLVGGASVYLGFRLGVSAELSWLRLGEIAGLSAVTFLWDLLLDTKSKRQGLITVLCHYFENSPHVRVGRPALAELELELPQEAAQTEVEYLKQSLDRIAASHELPQEEPARRRLTPEEESVIKEIVKEYLT